MRHLLSYWPKLWRAPLLFALVILAIPAANAARVRQTIVGCREEADAKKRVEPPALNRRSAAPAKLAAPCSDLQKGMTVTVEQTDGQFLCVRPWGGLECFWTQSAAIDQNNDRAPAAPKPIWGKAHFNGFKPSFATQF
jgi:hypothetical protein